MSSKWSSVILLKNTWMVAHVLKSCIYIHSELMVILKMWKLPVPSAPCAQIHFLSITDAGFWTVCRSSGWTLSQLGGHVFHYFWKELKLFNHSTVVLFFTLTQCIIKAFRPREGSRIFHLVHKCFFSFAFQSLTWIFE